MHCRCWCLSFCLGLFLGVWYVQTAAGAGLTWPSSQFFPTFATPASTIDAISMDSIPSDQQALFCSLEGIVNRTQPRIACVSAASEGAYTWLTIHNLSYDTLSGFAAISKYETNVTGLVVYDTNLMDTLNLATTIAGVKNELVCDAALLPTLTNSPYNLAIKDDLRGMFTTKYQVYGYLYTNYWSQCTHRLMAGLETNCYWYLRDYLVATKCAVVWLDPSVTADNTVFTNFVENMAPVGGAYIGWWPNESADMQKIAAYGIPVVASDLFDNATVYGGVASTISVPAIPPAPALQNKVYVSLTLSDGDNVQYMQHTMKMNWGSSARGTVPIGWTVQPLLADFDPAMLNYFWSTATTDDCLVAGPSGGGYTRINYWSAGNVANYTKASNFYLQRSGIRAATIWLTVSSATADMYATNCPTLLGVDDYGDGYYTTSDDSLPVLGFPANGNYATSVSNILNVITNTAASWNGSSPMFISVQADAWDVNPADCQTVANSLNSSEYVVVRPDHLFLLYRQAAGLGPAGAAPYVCQPPASQSALPGNNVTFSVIATGTSSLSYQWQMNGANIAGATGSTFTKSGVQAADLGNYQVVVTNNYGAVTSSIAALTFGDQPLVFNGSGLNWTLNENSGFEPYSTPAITNNVLTLTDGNGSEAKSVFFESPQYIGAFKARFTYQAGGNKGADGVTFCLQDDPRGASALGGGGGQLGVGTASPITPSVELELDIYTAPHGYAFSTNGSTGSYTVPGAINVASGDPINVTMLYQSGQLALTVTDAVANAGFSTNLTVNIPGLIGMNTAYVGFTGADGAATSIQTISNFEFESLPCAAIQSGGGNVSIGWTAAAPGFALQQNFDLTTTNWVQATGSPFVTNGMNQVTVPAATNMFYRLVLPGGF